MHLDDLATVMRNVFLLLFGMLLVGQGAAKNSASPAQSECIPDSILFEGNQRWWYPGEPLKWAPPEMLDSLLDAPLDGFRLTVFSPRSPDYKKDIRYHKFTPENEVLFVTGDCRYISYTPKTRTNHSNSIVVGHTYYAHPYWYNGALQFQNGWGNWNVHNQRLRHSRVTGEILDTPLPKGPKDIGYSSVHSCDSGMFMIRINTSDVRQVSGQEVYFLAHENPQWSFIGTLSAEFGSDFKRTITTLEDYWVFRSRSAFLVRRKSDGKATRVSDDGVQKFFEKAGSFSDSPNGIVAWTGNKLSYQLQKHYHQIDFDSLTHNASWIPFVVQPSSPNPSSNPSQTNDPFQLATFLLLVLSAILFVLLLQKNRKARFDPPLQPFEANAPYSPLVMTLAVYNGKTLTAEEFDDLMGLGSIHSPETRRSRRARIIQLVNAEVSARLGLNLIERSKSKEDKRVVIYNIGSIYEEDSP